MTDTPSRRDFLKTGLAATAAVVVGAKFSRADNQPQLFDKTRIGSLELSNRAIKSSTWSGMADQKGYVTDRILEFYGELAQGDIGLILTGYQYIMTNGQGLPYMVGNYDDTQVEGLTKLVNAVHKHGGKVVVQLVHSLARANPKMFFNDGDELWGASAIPYSPGRRYAKGNDQRGYCPIRRGARCRCHPFPQVRVRWNSDPWGARVWCQPVPISRLEPPR